MKKLGLALISLLLVSACSNIEAQTDQAPKAIPKNKATEYCDRNCDRDYPYHEQKRIQRHDDHELRHEKNSKAQKHIHPHHNQHEQRRLRRHSVE